MAQEITTGKARPAPVPQTREFADMLARYSNAIERSPSGRLSISSALAPRGGDLARIDQRKGELLRGLERADPRQIVPRIARLFLRFPNFKPVDPEATAAAYATDLSDFPLWAIEAGMIALLKGIGLPNKEFAPSSPSVREVVAREVQRTEMELAAINRVLQAEPRAATGQPGPDPNRRKALLQAVDDMIGGMRRSTEGPPRGGMTEDELVAARAMNAALAAGRPDPCPLPKLSDAARKALRLPDTREDAA